MGFYDIEQKYPNIKIVNVSQLPWVIVEVNVKDAPHQELELLNTRNSYTHVDVRNSKTIVEALTDFRPRNILSGVLMVRGRDSSTPIR